MSIAGPKVRTALQINMHPFDAPHVVHTLPHQLRAWGSQVDRVVLTVDTRLANAGRYRAAHYEQARDKLMSTLAQMSAQHPQLVVDEVRYDPATRDSIAKDFFGGGDFPDRAFDGGPFYVYFHGLHRANADYVLHMDSDMLFGGLGKGWIEEAITVLERHPDTLFACPFPGPPRRDGTLDASRHIDFPGMRVAMAPQPITDMPAAYRFAAVSTRIFLIDMERFRARVGRLRLVRPDFRRRLRALAYREAPSSMPAEEVLSANMVELGLSRIDFLGSGNGMFSLHPPYRTPEFYARLPELIARTERGDVPEEQRGDFDMNGAMIDWTPALATKTRSARWRKAAAQLWAVQSGRFRQA